MRFSLAAQLTLAYALSSFLRMLPACVGCNYFGSSFSRESFPFIDYADFRFDPSVKLVLASARMDMRETFR